MLPPFKNNDRVNVAYSIELVVEHCGKSTVMNAKTTPPVICVSLHLPGPDMRVGPIMTFKLLFYYLTPGKTSSIPVFLRCFGTGVEAAGWADASAPGYFSKGHMSTFMSSAAI